MGTASVLQELALVAYNEHCIDHGSFFKLAKVHACCVHLSQFKTAHDLLYKPLKPVLKTEAVPPTSQSLHNPYINS